MWHEEVHVYRYVLGDKESQEYATLDAIKAILAQPIMGTEKYVPTSDVIDGFYVPVEAKLIGCSWSA